MPQQQFCCLPRHTDCKLAAKAVPQAAAVLQAAAEASQSGQQVQHWRATGSQKAAPRYAASTFTQCAGCS